MAALLTSELVELTIALEKAAVGGAAVPATADASAAAAAIPDLPRALDILRRLLSLPSVSAADLRVSKAGLLVSKLGKSHVTEMATLAKQLIAQWKAQVLPPSAPTGVEREKAAAHAAAQKTAAEANKRAAEAAAAAAAAAKKKASEESSDSDKESRKSSKKDKKRKEKEDSAAAKKRSKTDSPSPSPPSKSAPSGSKSDGDRPLAQQHPELAKGPFALFATDDFLRDKMQLMLWTAVGEVPAAAKEAARKAEEIAKTDLSQYKSTKATTASAAAAPAAAVASPPAADAATASPPAADTTPASALPVAPAAPVAAASAAPAATAAPSASAASAAPAAPAAPIVALPPAVPSFRSRIELAFSIEAAMFNKFGQNSNGTAYKQKYRDLAPQLKDPSNEDLNLSLYLGRISPDELVSMTVAQLAPAFLKEKRSKEAAWNKEAARCDIGMDAGATDIFQCDVCKERNCTYFQMQTRGADEPMTIFVTCLSCGNKFRSGDGER